MYDFSSDKVPLGADGLLPEAVLRYRSSILLLFNLLAEFQRAAGLPRYQQPATLRAQVLTCGSILGRAGRRIVPHLSESWRGLAQRVPLLDSNLTWQIPTSPKLHPELIT
jgi:hypothetical protein